jgi:hypothetical protein
MQNFLIRVAILKQRGLATRQRNDRGVRQKGILKTGCEIGRADRLRHRHRWFTADASITVGHVRCTFFRVGDNALDANLFHFDQAPAQNRQDEKDMVHTLRRECLCNVLSPIHNPFPLS